MHVLSLSALRGHLQCKSMRAKGACIQIYCKVMDRVLGTHCEPCIITRPSSWSHHPAANDIFQSFLHASVPILCPAFHAGCSYSV